METLDTLTTEMCVNARAASDLNEATRVLINTIMDDDFWEELTLARHEIHRS